MPYQPDKSKRNGNSMDMLEDCNSDFSGMKNVRERIMPRINAGARAESTLRMGVRVGADDDFSAFQDRELTGKDAVNKEKTQQAGREKERQP